MPDPLWRLRLLSRATSALGAVAIIVAAEWALTPTKPDGSRGISSNGAPDPGAFMAAQTRIDWTAFDLSLWQPFPVAFVASPTPPQPKQAVPMRLELLAIATDEDKVLSAVLYDPSTHKVHRAQAGSVISQHRIASIDTSGIDVELSGRTQRLSLEREVR